MLAKATKHMADKIPINQMLYKLSLLNYNRLEFTICSVRLCWQSLNMQVFNQPE
jgi:hypothetical protein